MAKKRQNNFNLVNGIVYFSIGVLPISILSALSFLTVIGGGNISNLEKILQNVQIGNAGLLFLNFIIQTILSTFGNSYTALLLFQVVFTILLVVVRGYLTTIRPKNPNNNSMNPPVAAVIDPNPSGDAMLGRNPNQPVDAINWGAPMRISGK